MQYSQFCKSEIEKDSVVILQNGALLICKNLFFLSLRYIAVVVPLKYNRNQFSMRQLALIGATWVLSLTVASPVIFGLNQVSGRNPHECKLEDDRFVVYSSICSFFVPCPVMLFLYYWMFRGLRRWSSGRSRSHLRCPARGPQSLSLRLGTVLHKEKGPAREKAVYLVPGGHSPAAPVISATQGSPASPDTTTPASPRSPVSPLTLTTDENQLPLGTESDPMTTQLDSVSDAEPMERPQNTSGLRENGLAKNHGCRRSRRHSKSSRVSGRERKAMKVLPVVVGMLAQCNRKENKLGCWICFKESQ